MLPIFHQRQQMHVERIESQRASFTSLGRVFEQHKARMAVLSVNAVLTHPVGNDLTVGDRVHLALGIRLKMHATMPAAIEGDRVDAMRAFELVHRVHHRIGVRPGRGHEADIGQKRRADDHDR
ncbi:hypothetical protein WT66_13085 [Burkholderia stagnalis]|nr:hypothetical protein WT18_31930 [Burkholderia stagnalis]KVP01502.1 hypothetical protein WT20_32155 [Burkholderia stagnalis]KVW93537.1 hypothetical protein WT30_19695 [Burkholderia stagnalis]KWH79369.1 hypothetical protein WT66_13085 [Burkholderia stagnalis]